MDRSEMAPPTDSYWFAEMGDSTFDPLDRDLVVDVAVIGGGITGLTTALHLLESGRTVAVLEADRIGGGTSGRTTAKLTAQHGLTYRSIVSRFGRRGAQQYADANQAAIAEVERRVEAFSIDADFERTSAHVYTTDPQETQALRAESAVARDLGLPAAYVDEPDGPFDMAGAVRFRHQAQFHPRRYLLGLTREIEAAGGFVHEETRATDLSAGPPARVSTDRDRTVTAADVVVASLFPMADPSGYFTRMHASHAHLLVVEIDDPGPQGMWLSADSSPWTFRPLPAADRELLLVGGQSHKLSDRDVPTDERNRRCEAFAREHFDVRRIEYRWTAHDYVPVDGVPFIGRRGPIADNVYVGTGFNKWGMSGGTAAGMILTGLIVQGGHPWAEVFDPMRVIPSAAGSFVRENASVGSRWVADRVRSVIGGTDSELSSLDRGDGRVIRRGTRPIAVARDMAGDLHAVSAVCPHMWCLVEWNGVDRTWDCPCHGSRFTVDGRMLFGPAVDDLEPVALASSRTSPFSTDRH